MCQALRVQWTIIPLIAPQPWIVCNGCGGLKPFKSSSKLRLNANGKRLDAWLIYKCKACDKTWNRPIFERRLVRDVDPASLAALHSNDPGWVQRLEFDINALRNRSRQIDEFGAVVVDKKLLNQDSDDCATIDFKLVVPFPTSLRLDRLLAAELALSRSQLQALANQKRLCTDPYRKDALRRRIQPRSRIILDLAGDPHLKVVREAAFS